MRIINLIVVHCTATQGNRTLSPEALDLMHRRRGFNGTGYHYYIRKDGTVHLTRPVERIGAHAKGFNASSIGICYDAEQEFKEFAAEDTEETQSKLNYLKNKKGGK